MSLDVSLVGTKVGKYAAVRYIARGASGLVFEGLDSDGARIALKVFDPDFIEKNGSDIQIERINRQLMLKGKHHDNLIDILDGGECPATGLYFIVMPFLPAPTLDKVVATMPRERIRPLVAQVAEAAKFLETQRAYHRDIKPANIVVLGDNFETAILLDLGVVRPLGLAELTDSTDTKRFVGTTQYSPPEFLLRDEDETADGFRAVTFYQIGAVLFDLLMRQPLFHDRKSPYAKLVRAVLIEEPIIDCTDAPQDLVRLARCCLLKDPSKRLRLVSWESFSQQMSSNNSIEMLKEQARRLRASKPSGNPSLPETTLATINHSTAKSLSTALKEVCIDDSETFPPVICTPLPRTDDSSSFVLTFAPSARHGLDKYLHCVFHVNATSAQPPIVEFSFAAGTSPNRLETFAASIPLRRLGHDTHTGNGLELCRAQLYRAFVEILEESIYATGDSSMEVHWLMKEEV